MSATTGVMCPVAAQVCCAGLLDTNSARYSTRGSALTLTAERPAGRGQAFAWRARGRLRRLWSNTDRGDSELARRVLEGRDAGLEEGIIDPSVPGS